MARQRFTANDVVRFVECDDDEPMMQDSDDEDFLCDEGKPINLFNCINYCYDLTDEIDYDDDEQPRMHAVRSSTSLPTSIATNPPSVHSLLPISVATNPPSNHSHLPTSVATNPPSDHSLLPTSVATNPPSDHSLLPTSVATNPPGDHSLLATALTTNTPSNFSLLPTSVASNNPQSLPSSTLSLPTAPQTPYTPAWSRQTHPVSVAPFTSPVGPTFHVPESPLDVFLHFSPDDFLQEICAQTNLYAQQVMGPAMYADWVGVSVPELKAYLGFSILMGIVKFPALEDYWKVDPFLHFPPHRQSHFPTVVQRYLPLPLLCGQHPASVSWSAWIRQTGEGATSH